MMTGASGVAAAGQDLWGCDYHPEPSPPPKGEGPTKCTGWTPKESKNLSMLNLPGAQLQNAKFANVRLPQAIPRGVCRSSPARLKPRPGSLAQETSSQLCMCCTLARIRCYVLSIRAL